MWTWTFCKVVKKRGSYVRTAINTGFVFCCLCGLGTQSTLKSRSKVDVKYVQRRFERHFSWNTILKKKQTNTCVQPSIYMVGRKWKKSEKKMRSCAGAPLTNAYQQILHNIAFSVLDTSSTPRTTCFLCTVSLRSSNTKIEIALHNDVITMN